MGDSEKRKSTLFQTGWQELDEPDFLKAETIPDPPKREGAGERTLPVPERKGWEAKDRPSEPEGIAPGRNFMGIPTEPAAEKKDPFAKLMEQQSRVEGEEEAPEEEASPVSEEPRPAPVVNHGVRHAKKKQGPTEEEAKAMAAATERIMGKNKDAEAPLTEKERRRRLSQQRKVRKVRRKRRVIAFFLSLILLGGLAYLDIPYGMAVLEERKALRSIDEYAELTRDLDSATTWEKLVAARDYNERLLKRRQNMSVNPYDMVYDDNASYDDQDVRYLFHLEYMTLLKADPSRIMGYVSIPRLWLKLPIYYGYNQADMKNGICHLEWTSLPVGGGSSHAVLLGYENEGKKRLFSNLDLLQKGDIIYVNEMNRTLNYRVSSVKEAYLGDVDAVEIQKNKDLLSLVAVRPEGSSLKRLYVTASRIGNVTEADPFPYPMALLRDWWWAALTVLALFVWFLIVRAYVHPERKQLKKMKKEKKARAKKEKQEARARAKEEAKAKAEAKKQARQNQE